MAETRDRVAAAAPSSPMPRAEQIAPTTAEPAEEPPVPGVSRDAPAGWAKNGSNDSLTPSRYIGLKKKPEYFDHVIDHFIRQRRMHADPE